MKILITGASGFIGSKVLEFFLKSKLAEELYVLSSKKIKNVKRIEAKEYKFGKNYLIENGCEEVDVLLHIGAWTPKSSEYVNNIDKSTENIVNTYNLLKCKLPSLKKIVYISTLDVYKNEKVITESTPTIPRTMYACSKLYCENIIKEYCQKEGYLHQILRLGHVYGEGEEAYKKVIPTMIRNAIYQKDINIYGDGKAQRTFIYIKDVVESIVKSLFLEQSEIINIVGNENISINHLAKVIRDISGRKIQIKYIESDNINQDYLFDNQKMKKLLLDKFTSLEDGLKNEYQYMESKIRI